MSQWGVVALVCGGLAVLSANVSAMIPPSILAGLHASRLDGGTLNQLRSEIGNLELAASELRRANSELLGRFSLAERSDGDIARRVGALEVSIPDLLEQIAPEGVDTSAVTASIGDAVSFETEGGSVVVQKRPLFPAAEPAPLDQPMPDLLVAAAAPVPDAGAFGLVLGPAVPPETAAIAWQNLRARIGPMLMGLGPLVASSPEGARLVAGPLPTRAEADALCARIAGAGVACTPAPFLGAPL